MNVTSLGLSPPSLALATIHLDGGTQVRARIDEDRVAEYAEAMKAGAEFPPVIVFLDGSDYWLADGFHRYHGARSAGLKRIAVDVRTGTCRDAILFACGANATHGLFRSNADKRRAVEILLADEEWKTKSDRWIAEQCAVSDFLVRTVRGELRDSRSTHTPRNNRTGKDGKVRVQPKAKVKDAETEDEETEAPEPKWIEDPAERRRRVDDVAVEIQRLVTVWPYGAPTDGFRLMLQNFIDMLNRREKIHGIDRPS